MQELTHLRRVGNVAWLGFTISRDYSPPDILASPVAEFRASVDELSAVKKLKRAKAQAADLSARISEVHEQIGTTEEEQKRVLNSPSLDRVEADAARLHDLDHQLAALQVDLASLERQKQLVAAVVTAATQERSIAIQAADAAKWRETRASLEAEQEKIKAAISSKVKAELERLLAIGAALEKLSAKTFSAATHEPAYSFEDKLRGVA